jgi:hypothetical protein
VCFARPKEGEKGKSGGTRNHASRVGHHVKLMNMVLPSSMLLRRKFAVRHWLNLLRCQRDFGRVDWQRPGGGAVYPVKVSANHRYLVDQKGAPFLIIGDCPQSLTVNLSVAQADSYFSNRQAHGFNTLWINLVCTVYTGGRPDGSTFDGMLPFTGYLPGGNDLSHFDLSKPNEAFFARCDQMIGLAAKYNLLVFLDPIETGGWLTNMVNNGPQGLLTTTGNISGIATDTLIISSG